MELKNKRIPDDEFARLRQEVLAQWPTGKDVDIQPDSGLVDHAARHSAVDRDVGSVDEIIARGGEEEAHAGDVVWYSYATRRVLKRVGFRKGLVLDIDPSRRNAVGGNAVRG